MVCTGEAGREGEGWLLFSRTECQASCWAWGYWDEQDTHSRCPPHGSVRGLGEMEARPRPRGARQSWVPHGRRSIPERCGPRASGVRPGCQQGSTTALGEPLPPSVLPCPLGQWPQVRWLGG